MYFPDSLLLYKCRDHSDKFLVIDIDPYGSAAPFFDASVQALADGGLLMITCTDVAILCGNASETCFAKYGSMSLRTESCHEMVSLVDPYLNESYLIFLIFSTGTSYCLACSKFLSSPLWKIYRAFVIC